MIDPNLADAQQAFVNELLDAIGTRALGPSEVSAIVIAKLLHLILQTGEEVLAAARESEQVLAASPEDAEGVEVLRIQLLNCKAIVELTEGMASGFQQQLQRLVVLSRRVVPVIDVPGTRRPRPQ